MNNIKPRYVYRVEAQDGSGPWASGGFPINIGFWNSENHKAPWGDGIGDVRGTMICAAKDRSQFHHWWPKGVLANAHLKQKNGYRDPWETSKSRRVFYIVVFKVVYLIMGRNQLAFNRDRAELIERIELTNHRRLDYYDKLNAA